MAMVQARQPLDLPCGLRLGNRLSKAALTEALADSHSRADGRLVALYNRWARGGIGLLITGNVQVDRRYLERPGNVVIDGDQDETQREGLMAWAAASKHSGTRVFMQLNHAGRQATRLVTKDVVGPSAIASTDLMSNMLKSTTRALSLEDIADIRRRFFNAAKVAKECGFEGVQIHAAHGYLLSSFLNPRANQREDQYGGSLENRARLLLEVVEEVATLRDETFALAVKINSSDFQKGGFTQEEFEQVVVWLDKRNVDLIEVSGGNYEAPAMMGAAEEQMKTRTKPSSTAAREAFFLEFAVKVRKQVQNAKFMVTGGFRTAAAMEAALLANECDVIGLGRPLCVDPECPGQILSGEISELPRVEDLAMPLILRPLSYFSIGHTLTMGTQQMHCYRALIALGDGKPVPTFKALRGLLEVQRYDAKCASNLEGLENSK